MILVTTAFCCKRSIPIYLLFSIIPSLKVQETHQLLRTVHIVSRLGRNHNIIYSDNKSFSTCTHNQQTIRVHRLNIEPTAKFLRPIDCAFEIFIKSYHLFNAILYNNKILIMKYSDTIGLERWSPIILVVQIDLWLYLIQKGTQFTKPRRGAKSWGSIMRIIPSCEISSLALMFFPSFYQSLSGAIKIETSVFEPHSQRRHTHAIVSNIGTCRALVKAYAHVPHEFHKEFW